MANGLFESPQDILARRRAGLNQAMQQMQQQRAKSKEGKLAGGLGQIAMAWLGEREKQKTEEQLGALGGALGGFQTEQDAIAAVDRTAAPSQTTDVQGALSQGYSPQVLAQQEAATNKLRDKAIANSGLDRELQGSVKLEDTRRRNGLSQEGLIKSAQAVYAENPELALKMVAQAKSMAPEVKKAPTTRVVDTDSGKQTQEFNVSTGNWDVVGNKKAEVSEGGKPTAKIKNQLALEAQGIPRSVAQDAVFGFTKTITDPTTGDLVLYDIRDNKQVGRVASSNLVDGQVPEAQSPHKKVLAAGSKIPDKIDKQVTALSTSLEKANILEMGSIFDLVEKQIINTEEDLAGFGQTGFLPSIALSDEGLANRQLIAQVQNITLKNRSGAAVTATEFDRLKKELGTGKITGDREVRHALGRMVELFNAHKKQLRAGFSDAANTEYDRRLGLPVGADVNTRLKYNPATGELE